MILGTFLVLLAVPMAFSLNHTFSPDEIEKFRTHEVKNVSVTVTETDESVRIEGARTVSARCRHDDICMVIKAPEEIVLSKENNFTATFVVQMEGKFLGLTDLLVKIDAEELSPYPLRVLRSAGDHKVTIAFTVFIAVFVVSITFMMGTQLEMKRIMKIVKAPVGPITGFFCQFGLMPTIGFLLAEFCLPDDNVSMKLALFAVSTCPGGGKSSFWTIIFGGNLDLSISMTFTQTLAALFMMPLWMSTAGSRFTDKHVQIPFARIIQGLFAVIIPTGIGIAFTHYRPQYVELIHKWIKRASWVAMIVITVFAVYTNYYMLWLITWPIVLCGCALPWLGYITAFVVATICRQEFKDCVTIAIETGIQNIGIAMLLMMWCLPEPESDISVTVIFVVAIMTDKPLVVIWLISRIYKKCVKKDTVSQIDLENGAKALGVLDEPEKVKEVEMEETIARSDKKDDHNKMN